MTGQEHGDKKINVGDDDDNIRKSLEMLIRIFTRSPRTHA
jgi:hypothetical protein